MTNTLMWWLIAGEIAAAIAVFALGRRIHRVARIVIAAIFIGVGILAILLTELEFAPSNTRAVEGPLNLAHAGQVFDAPFTTNLGGRFEVFLETGHTPGIAKFGCLTGDEHFEPLCPTGDPELDAAWTVKEQGVAVARGGSDLAGWRRRQAALNPADAAKRRADFLADIAKTENPSDGTPLFHSLGFFEAQRGHAYRFTLLLAKPAPTLAAAYPRVLVGYSGEQTKGLGLLVVLFCLIGVVSGGAMLLTARGKSGMLS